MPGMPRDHFIRTTLLIPRPRDEVFAFFGQAENLGRITPAELDFRIRTPLPIEMRPGTLIDYTIKLHGIPMPWRTLISEWEPPHHFVDEQLRGPYAVWVHRHSFTDTTEGGTLITDEVRYRLPLSPLGDLALPIVRHQLRKIFNHRQEIVHRLLAPAGTPLTGTVQIG